MYHRSTSLCQSHVDRFRWKIACDLIDKLKSQLNRAECKLYNAKDALGKWLTPDDALQGEAFHIWVEGKMLEVVRTMHTGEFEVRWRKLNKLASNAPES